MANVYMELLKSTLLSEEDRCELQSEYFDSIENDMIEADLKILELGLDTDLLFDERLKGEIEMTETEKAIQYLDERCQELSVEIQEMVCNNWNNGYDEIIKDDLEHLEMLTKKLNQLKGEIKMTNLKNGMVVEVELNYGEIVGTITEVSENNDQFYIEDEKGTMWKFYSDIHKVTILDEAIFHGMENVEVLNKDDFQYFDNAYKVSLHNYDNKWFGVYASCEQDALDIVVDHLEEKGLTGYFYNMQEREELEKDGHEDMFIVAGNHCHNLDAEHVFIESVK